MNREREALETYFQNVDEAQVRLRASKASDSKLRLLTKHAVPVKFRGTARMLITDALATRERRKAGAILASGEPIRLHLGCGGEHKQGWVNVDLVGDPVDLAWDLARGIPFPDDSVEAIFHEHLLEHIPLRSGASFMAECFRVLRSGGILRVGVPDAGELIKSYAADGRYLEELHPGRPTRMLAVQELFYWHRHTTMFDVDTLALLFRASGFPDPTPKAFGDTSLAAAPDTERRRAETLYMEAVKP